MAWKFSKTASTGKSDGSKTFYFFNQLGGNDYSMPDWHTYYLTGYSMDAGKTYHVQLVRQKGDYRKNNTEHRLFLKKFSSYPKALNFAKQYMRNHKKGE